MTGGTITALLWVLTILVSDSPVLAVTAFWLIAGGGIIFWVHRDLRAEGGHMEHMAAALESAIRRNEADVYDIRSSAFVEFEEIEDEGACYAFQIDETRIVFLSGQEFYETARFPSLDFSLVFPLDEDGRQTDMYIERRSPKASPHRRIPARVKPLLKFPKDLEIIEGELIGLEERLTR